jgi:hypothetical protein
MHDAEGWAGRRMGEIDLNGGVEEYKKAPKKEEE